MVKRYRLLVVLLTTLVVIVQAEGNNDGGNSKKDNMEHLFPLLFLMGGAPTVHCPAVWLLGMLSVVVVLFVGAGQVKVKNV